MVGQRMVLGNEKRWGWSLNTEVNKEGPWMAGGGYMD